MGGVKAGNSLPIFGASGGLLQNYHFNQNPIKVILCEAVKCIEAH